MPFNPNLPIDDSLLDAGEMRSQFTGLAAMIQSVPAGPPGPMGPAGAPGPRGPQGEAGMQGPPFAQAVVDGVMTTDPGTPANVTVYFDGTYVHFSFDIPRGATGEQEPPGEVTTSQLDAAMATTALNPSGVGPYTGTFSDPPTQGEMQDFAGYVESLRVALARG